MKVFLSRNQPSEELLEYIKNSGNELVYFSCIYQKLAETEPPPKSDWIFFYSPGAASLFLENFDLAGRKVGVLGKGTAKPLTSAGLTPDFIGSDASPSEAVKEFAQHLGESERVVQARGEKSFERLRSAISDDQILDWILYRTEVAETAMQDVNADVFIFTSPSNAGAYLGKYKINDQAVLISLGESTTTHLESLTKNTILQAEYPSEKSVIDVLKKVQS